MGRAFDRESQRSDQAGNRDAEYLMIQTPIRLIIADDHALFRQGLKSLLQLQPDIEVGAEVERATELRTTLSNTHCDVLLLDMQMDRWVMEDIPDLAKLTTLIV